MESTIVSGTLPKVAPRFTARDAYCLNNFYRGSETVEMLEDVLRNGALGDTALVSSFGAESAVLIHLVASVARDLPIFFLDTGRHFPETYAYRDTLINRFGLGDVRSISPDPAAVAKLDPEQLRAGYDPDGCCALRKTTPFNLAILQFDSIVTGRKAYQATTRQAMPRFELRDERISFNPLANWTRDDIQGYFLQHDLPGHPLERDGYLSIGCAPCTSRVVPGEDPRSGRWRGFEKTECGIHHPVTPTQD